MIIGSENQTLESGISYEGTPRYLMMNMFNSTLIFLLMINFVSSVPMKRSKGVMKNGNHVQMTK